MVLIIRRSACLGLLAKGERNFFCNFTLKEFCYATRFSSLLRESFETYRQKLLDYCCYNSTTTHKGNLASFEGHFCGDRGG